MSFGRLGSLGGGFGRLGAGGGVGTVSAPYDPETELGAKLLGYWDAEDSALITRDGSNLVSSWKDRIGAYDLVQGTGSLKPVYNATGFNGFACNEFDGTDDQLTLATIPASFPSVDAQSELWIVFQNDSLVADTGTKVPFNYGGTAGTSQRRVSRTVVSGANRGLVTNGINNITGTNVAINSRHVIRGTFGSNAELMEVDGVSEGTAVSTSNTGTSRVRMGASGNSTAASFLLGKVAVAMVTSALSAPEASALTTYLLTRRRL